MAGKTVRGIAYMCPANCSRYEDATGFDYSREPEVSPPAGDGQAGTIVAFLLAKRPGTTFNPETGNSRPQKTPGAWLTCMNRPMPSSVPRITPLIGAGRTSPR